MILTQEIKTGTFTVRGTIKDGSQNSSSWSFTITIDSTAPTLTVQNQNMRKQQTLNLSPTIRNRRSGEVITVTVNSVTPLGGSPSVTWDSTNERFVLRTKDQANIFTVRGTIKDGSQNSSSWSFTITVDSTAPTLTAQNQNMKGNQTLNLSPTIGNRRSGEVVRVTVSSITPFVSGGPSVTWDSTNERFVLQSGSAYNTFTVRGTIKDASQNSSSWSFTITVDSTAPTLTAQDQTMEVGSSKTHAPTIGSLRSGESYTVTVNAVSTGAPSVVWDSVNSRFSINAGTASLGSAHYLRNY